jgi:hypothetical protein
MLSIRFKILSLFCPHVASHSCTYCYVLRYQWLSKFCHYPAFFKCFVYRASRYICVIKTNLMHLLSSVYFVNQPLNVSGIFVAHHQEVYCINTTIGTYYAFQLTVCWPAAWPTSRQLTEKHNTYQLLYLYNIPPDDGLQICRKHVEVDWRNKLRITNASGWFLLHRLCSSRTVPFFSWCCSHGLF